MILNYDGFALTAKCLSSLRIQTYSPLDIIVVDNGSADGSPIRIPTMFPEVQLVVNDVNLGYSRGNNRGIEKALIHEAAYVFLLNNDTVVERHCLQTLVAAFEGSEGSVGALQPKLLALEDPQFVDSTGQLVSPIAMVVERGRGEKDDGRYDTSLDIFAGKGAAVLIKAEVFRRIGLLDPMFFLTYDDIDFSFRMRAAGYIARYCPEAIVYHSWGSPTSKHFTALNTYESYKNQLHVILKNYESPTRAVTYALLTILVMTLRGLRSLLLLNPTHIATVIRAIWWNVKNLRRLRFERQKIAAYRLVRDRNIVGEDMISIVQGLKTLGRQLVGKR